MRAARIAVVVVLAVLAWWLPAFRRDLIFDVTYHDATPGEPVQLPGGSGPGLSRVAHTRVVLVDGLSADVAPSMPTQMEAQLVRVPVTVGTTQLPTTAVTVPALALTV